MNEKLILAQNKEKIIVVEDSPCPTYKLINDTRNTMKMILCVHTACSISIYLYLFLFMPWHNSVNSSSSLSCYVKEGRQGNSFCINNGNVLMFQLVYKVGVQ